MTEQERIKTPLSREEKLAAFLVSIRALDAGGSSAGFGRISREDDGGVDFTFSLPNFMVRKICDAHPEAVIEARDYWSEGPTNPSEAPR